MRDGLWTHRVLPWGAGLLGAMAVGVMVGSVLSRPPAPDGDRTVVAVRTQDVSAAASAAVHVPDAGVPPTFRDTGGPTPQPVLVSLPDEMGEDGGVYEPLGPGVARTSVPTLAAAPGAAEAGLSQMPPLGPPRRGMPAASEQVGMGGPVEDLPGADGSVPAGASGDDAEAEVEAPPSPPPPPPTAVARVSVAEALGVPMLVRSRGPRLVFYSMSSAQPEPLGGLAGQWAVPGRCGTKVLLRYAQGARGFGSVRGIGVGSVGGRGLDLVVPAQACGAASGRVQRPSALTAGSVAEIDALVPGGAAGAQAVREGSRVWVAGAGGAALLERSGGGWRTLWKGEMPEGRPALVAVYRRGGSSEAWFVVGGGGGRIARLVRVHAEGSSWLDESTELAGG